MTPHPVLQIRHLGDTMLSAGPDESQKSPLQTVRPTSTEATVAAALTRSPCCRREKPAASAGPGPCSFAPCAQHGVGTRITSVRQTDK